MGAARAPTDDLSSYCGHRVLESCQQTGAQHGLRPREVLPLSTAVWEARGPRLELPGAPRDTHGPVSRSPATAPMARACKWDAGP